MICPGRPPGPAAAAAARARGGGNVERHSAWFRCGGFWQLGGSLCWGSARAAGLPATPQGRALQVSAQVAARGRRGARAGAGARRCGAPRDARREPARAAQTAAHSRVQRDFCRRWVPERAGLNNQRALVGRPRRAARAARAALVAGLGCVWNPEARAAGGAPAASSRSPCSRQALPGGRFWRVSLCAGARGRSAAGGRTGPGNAALSLKCQTARCRPRARRAGPESLQRARAHARGASGGARGAEAAGACLLGRRPPCRRAGCPRPWPLSKMEQARSLCRSLVVLPVGGK